MSEVDRLQALLARVQGNRRPAPPNLAQVLASVGSPPAQARPAAPAPSPVASRAPTPSPAIASPVASRAPTPSPAIASPVARKPPEPTPLEAALSRSPTPSPSVVSPEHVDAEIDVVMEVEEEDVRTGEYDISAQEAQVAAERQRADAEARAQREQERAAQEREQRAAQEREQRAAQEREQRAAQEREQRAAQEREQRAAREREQAEAEALASQVEEREVVMMVDDDESPTFPQPIAPLAAKASAPVARISRPLDTTPSTFGQLMRRTLALRPR